MVDQAEGRPPAPTAWRADGPPPAQRLAQPTPWTEQQAPWTQQSAPWTEQPAWVGQAPQPDAWRSPQVPSWEDRHQRIRHSRFRSASRSLWLPVVLLLVLVGGRWAAVHPDRVSAAWTELTSGDLGPIASQPGTQPPAGAPAGGDASAPSPDGTYAFLSTQTLPDGTVVPLTWSTCGQIRYTVSAAGAPINFRQRVAAVAQELSDATGLVFLDVDTATMITRTAPPVTVELPAQGPIPPVLIAFADESSDPVLEGDVVGVASTSAGMDPSTGRSYFTTGVVHLDEDLLRYGESDGEPAYVSTLRHEMGHLVGLDHVDDASQLMTPVEAGVHTYQAGDLAGLALLGAGGCASGL